MFVVIERGEVDLGNLDSSENQDVSPRCTNHEIDQVSRRDVSIQVIRSVTWMILA